MRKTDGSVGCWCRLGFKLRSRRLGVVVALTFIGLPFVVRTVQPVLQDLETELEEAAATLGATRLQTFQRVIGPALLPALITGFALAFARALGEYGSVVFISGNMPMRTEVVPLLIMTKLEQFDYQGATAIALVMLVISFTMLFGINLLQRWSATRHAARLKASERQDARRRLGAGRIGDGKCAPRDRGSAVGAPPDLIGTAMAFPRPLSDHSADRGLHRGARQGLRASTLASITDPEALQRDPPDAARPRRSQSRSIWFSAWQPRGRSRASSFAARIC